MKKRGYEILIVVCYINFLSVCIASSFQNYRSVSFNYIMNKMNIRVDTLMVLW